MRVMETITKLANGVPAGIVLKRAILAMKPGFHKEEIGGMKQGKKI